MSHISSTNTVKSIYFVYFHSIMRYGIIFWGKSCNSKKTFALQKKITRILAGVRTIDSCRNLLRRLEILTLPCKYIFSLMNFTLNNQEHFQTNSALYSVNLRNRQVLHRLAANLLCFQKSACYSGMKIFNNVP
jgi:IS1 family transposase